MGGGPLHILFLCPDNAVRSILAEALLNHFGTRNFRAYSAGIEPSNEVHDGVLHILNKNGIPTDGLRAKTWQEYALKNAPALDGVFLLAENMEPGCLDGLPGDPKRFCCPLPDPAGVQGNASDIKAAFQVTFEITRVRVRWLLEIQNRNHEPDAFFEALSSAPFFSPLK